ncbi:hypothetical protein CPB84DRAFT_1849539 [Gymnopilus junonius]|uniref:F-box domain-containing protein n=1 Tax=Gymnopilus junonius TaxID=109634 RepID=A0A9P5NJG2_GYMJU|nr:hypothetical protein CPB84DRAFT_1849539 [Gymnopilus junonius]
MISELGVAQLYYNNLRGRNVPTKAAPTAPSISRLNQNILWEIFLWNTNIFDELRDLSTYGALTTTRRTSQVCQTWRAPLLDAPSIWGRLTNFEELNQSNERWKMEVICISMFCPLWIKATLKHTREDGLEPGWSGLSLGHAHSLEKGSTPPSASTSPTFMLALLSKSQIRTSPIALFNSSAPLLHNLELQHISVRFIAPGFSQLRRIRLPSFLTIKNTLSALRLMPVLECLSLAELNISSTRFLFALVLLEHIHPQPGCVLSLHSEADSKSDSLLGITRLFTRSLTPFIWEYIERNSVRQILLSFDTTNHMIFLTDTTPRSHTRPSLTIEIECEDGFPAHPAICFPILFWQCCFTSVTSMFLDLQPLSFDPSPVYSNYIFTTLSSLIELDLAEEHTLRSFLRNPDPPHYPDLDDSSEGGDGRAILLFLHQCREGAPIAELQFWVDPEDSIQDIMFLEEITGLRVVWDGKNETLDYICGSGRPEVILAQAKEQVEIRNELEVVETGWSSTSGRCIIA